MSDIWNPKVSIIIPVYNGANYMREAIDSALAQTYPNIEVIVVNDGSNDNGETDRIARSYGEQIRYFYKENGGVSSALNYGISQMTGAYFSWLSHDDVYSPEKITHQIDNMRSLTDSKDNTIALCAHSFIGSDSKQLAKKAARRFTPGIYDWRAALLELLERGTFSGCALLIPKTAFELCGTFHEGLRFSQDTLMWMQIFLHRFSLVYNADEDVYSRIHGKQLTQNGRTVFQKDSETIGKIVIPQLVEISDKTDNYLYAYAKRNALHANCGVVKACITDGRKGHLLGWKQRLALKLRLLYGRIRPVIRRGYYRVFVKVKTQ